PIGLCVRPVALYATRPPATTTPQRPGTQERAPAPDNVPCARGVQTGLEARTSCVTKTAPVSAATHSPLARHEIVWSAVVGLTPSSRVQAGCGAVGLVETRTAPVPSARAQNAVDGHDAPLIAVVPSMF